MRTLVGVAVRFVCLASMLGCEFPKPTDVAGLNDGSVDGNANDAAPSSACTANQPLRCEGGELVRCNADGTAEVSEVCALGCSTAEMRCADINPSNELAPYLDMTAAESDLDLGAVATIDTDTGAVTADGVPMAVKSAAVTQPSAPTIRVLVVHSLTAEKVTVTGTNALAVMSHGDVRVGAVFSASARNGTPGPGTFSDVRCRGKDNVLITRGLSGAGGGGFGTVGGRGGTAINENGTARGGDGGAVSGNSVLVPLRGGCDSGAMSGLRGGAGGALQIVSRTRIVVSGVIAANGSSISGGGSGGGILLEAPLVEVSGAVVANGGGGAGGCIGPLAGEDGRLDAAPASGGMGCGSDDGSRGGAGAAGNSGAGNGGSSTETTDTSVFGGHGGGGVGRIRVNSAAGGLRSTGLFSPNPTTGTVASR